MMWNRSVLDYRKQANKLSAPTHLTSHACISAVRYIWTAPIYTSTRLLAATNGVTGIDPNLLPLNYAVFQISEWKNDK